MELLKFIYLFLIFFLNYGYTTSEFIRTQCGDNICGQNAVCKNISAGLCVCMEDHLGLPNEKCFKTCINETNCLGEGNECLYHDAYFSHYKKTNYSLYNYPYSHHHCRYDCVTDEDCGRNAVCTVAESKKQCKCKISFIGLPYLQCFPVKNNLTIGRSNSNELDSKYSKCPILPKSEGVKISCLDRDGSEHNCSNGGNFGTSAMFTCEKYFRSNSARLKFVRLKCGSNGKWSKYKAFECLPSHFKPKKDTIIGNFDYLY